MKFVRGKLFLWVNKSRPQTFNKSMILKHGDYRTGIVVNSNPFR